MNIDQKFAGDQLRKLRKNHRKTINEVAKGTGMSIAKISYLERGSRSITKRNLQKIAKYFNLKYQNILGMINEVPESETDRRHMSGHLPYNLPIINPLGDDFYREYLHLKAFKVVPSGFTVWLLLYASN